ncbi:MAG: hypothetical protein AAF221_11365 [Pseudomonadota bacterium]
MSDLRRTILITTQLKGFAEEPVVATMLGIRLAEVSMMYEVLTGEGFAVQRPAGIKLTKTGIAAAKSAWAAERDIADKEALAALHADFKRLDKIYKPILSDWRMVKTDQGPARNDHHDSVYDEALIDETFAACTPLAPLLRALTALVPRCRTYRNRLDSALNALEQGDTRFMSDTDVDSVHIIWSELAADLSGLQEA